MESIIYQATLAPKSEQQDDPVHAMGKDGIPVLTPIEEDIVAQAHILDQQASGTTEASEVVMVRPEQVLAAKRHAIVLRRIVRDVQKSPAPPATFQPVLMSAADQLDKLALALAEISTAMEKSKEIGPAPILVTPEEILSRKESSVELQLEGAVSQSAQTAAQASVVSSSPELEADLALAKQRALRFEQALNAICEVLDKAADRPVEQWTISSAAEVANEMGDLATRALEEFKSQPIDVTDGGSDYIEHKG